MARLDTPLPPALPAAITWSLRIGVALAAVLLAVGTLLALAHGSTSAIGTPSVVSSEEFATGSAWFDGTAFLLLGVAVLLLTPIARVLLSLALFAAARDGAFTLITGIVVAILAASVLVGAGA